MEFGKQQPNPGPYSLFKFVGKKLEAKSSEMNVKREVKSLK